MAAISSLTTREYSSGSCTLRITGQLSPLSQLAKKPVMMKSRFYLQLLPEEELGEAEVPSSAGMVSVSRLELSGRAEQLSALMVAINGYVQRRLTAANGTGQSSSNPGFPSGIGLQPLGLTRHRLTLPQDMHSGQGSEAELSALELADLADVLEQADGDLYLPIAKDLPQPRAAKPKLPIWIGSAVAVGIAAVLGSQWLSVQTYLPTAIHEGDTPLEDTQESETYSQEPTQTLESSPTTEPEASSDRPVATVEENQSVAVPQTTVEPTSPSTETPAARSTFPAPLPTDLANGPSAASSPIPETTAAAETSQAPGTVQSPAAVPAPANESAYPAPASAREEELGQAEAFSEPDLRPESLSLPETSNNTGVAGSVPDRALEDGMAVSGDSILPWQEQLRQHLQQGWTPPADQAEPLRYRISIDSEGILESISPLSARAQQYQERISWPEVGTPIAMYPEGAAAVLELQFLPTGEVIIGPIASPSNSPPQE